MNYKKLLKTKTKNREQFFPVNGLKDFEIWEDGEPVGFKVRGLSGKEFGEVRNRIDKKEQIQGLISAMVGGDPKETLAKIESFFHPDVTDEYATAMELFIRALVEPEIPEIDRLDIAGYLYQNFPVDLLVISKGIQQMTGLGALPGESKGSGKSRKSETP